MVQAQGVGVRRPRGVEGDGLALHGLAALDAHGRLTQVDGGGGGVQGVGVGHGAERVAGARGGGYLECVGGDVIAGGVGVREALHVVEGDGVLAGVAVGHGEIGEVLQGGDVGAERAVVQGVGLGHHVHVGVHLRVAASPRGGESGKRVVV